MVVSMGSRTSRVRIEVELEVPVGDDEGVYREEFRREFAKRLLNILLDRDTTSAKEVIEEVLREKEGDTAPKPHYLGPRSPRKILG